MRPIGTPPEVPLSTPVMAGAPSPAKASPAALEAPQARTYLVDRMNHGKIALAQIYADGFDKLSLRERKLAFHLSLAAYAGQEIAYDQLGWQNVALKRFLESIYVFGRSGDAQPDGFDAQLEDYLKQFYANGGNHGAYSGEKIMPDFNRRALRKAAFRAFRAGAPMGVANGAELRRTLNQLWPTIFDPKFEPEPVPTFYGEGVTPKDFEGFEERHALNSRVVKDARGKLSEEVYRAGTPDGRIAPGLYARQLARVIEHLGAAHHLARGAQRDALDRLIRYLETGSLDDWDTFNIAWVRANPDVDASIGFIESYNDAARNAKGTWQGFVNFKDPDDTRIMEVLRRRVQYFEDRMPWPAQYKREKIPTPPASAVDFLTVNPASPAGINLPNEQRIREDYGSKSISVSNVMDAADAVKRGPMALEFAATPEDREAARLYNDQARKLLVAMHEVIGHGSGKVSDQVDDPVGQLKEYENVLEEARADLVALWFAFDPVFTAEYPDANAVGEQMYRSFLVEALTNLRYEKTGDTLSEDHLRGTQMTLSWLIEKGAVERATVDKGGRTNTAYRVVDFEKMHEAVGELLSQLMVIKAEGRYEEIKTLVTERGEKFDPKLRDEVIARLERAGIPDELYAISPRLVPELDAVGQLVDVRATYGQSLIEQHLERGLLGAIDDPKVAVATAARLGREQGSVLREVTKPRRPAV